MTTQEFWASITAGSIGILAVVALTALLMHFA